MFCLRVALRSLPLSPRGRGIKGEGVVFRCVAYPSLPQEERREEKNTTFSPQKKHARPLSFVREEKRGERKERKDISPPNQNKTLICW